MSDPIAERVETRYERAERVLAMPVLIAAIASVPGVLLSLWGPGTWATAGSVINLCSGALMWMEFAVLFVLSENKFRWLRRNWWLCLIIVVTLPAVVYSLGPAQLLRIVYSVSTLRILRVRKIIKAGNIVQDKLKLRGWARTLVLAVVILVSMVLIGVLILDPNSDTWVVAELLADSVGLGPALILVGAVTLTGLVLWRKRRRRTARVRR
ncbi:hypothetical protein [Stackebrandtia nassauensis]|uniref:Uncharacterized protein n=1 Tax=Stackebrandtia nassauensis (strain DSM 44728 / CIP 108903 / NRRL B-16338 / NBRC 102104 / LLR-40K-21) TaxID=446470 RepID=D3PW40_STANL|nr:hypothetical protein [Stackebrandtia nassauensis]ADD45161.1 hypothetical protein Snas_5530 [Stackebrandtia nassauensis DSM 44728]